MDRLPEIRRHFAFDAWANREVLAALRALPEPPPGTVKTLAHVAGVLRLWLSRIDGGQSPLAVWPDLDLEATARELDAATGLWRRQIELLRTKDLDREVAYVNSLGEAWTSTVGDILTQTLFHGVHHRAQILADLRRAGHVPPYVDFIHAARTGRLDG
ncbi:MAG TPA: DinB family protein [Thermoanaerobaculia bacterium]|nr:DinB family protein [Thermoanaerobaculia bacterium]